MEFLKRLSWSPGDRSPSFDSTGPAQLSMLFARRAVDAAVLNVSRRELWLGRQLIGALSVAPSFASDRGLPRGLPTTYTRPLFYRVLGCTICSAW